MVLISKSERAEISKAFPNLYIVRTMRQDSKRGHYYCPEDRGAMKLLREIRERNVVAEYPPRKQSKPKSNYKQRYNG